MRGAKEVTIRPMEEADLPFVRRGLAETNWQDIPEDQKAFLARAECDRRIFDDFDRFLKEPKFKFQAFVATLEDGKPAGYVSVGELNNPAVGLPMGGVIDFWVAPELRKRGIGGTLLDYALGRIKSSGYSHASVMVSASNEGALKLYGARGFAPDRLVLAKKL
jgi:ribosomal protein S18 acetylase RimI-like enzyme